MNLQANQFSGLFAEYVSAQGGLQMVKNADSSVRLSNRAGDTSTLTAKYHRNGEVQIVPQYKYQNLLRPLFGKGDSSPPSIGDHPDFEHLRGTDLEEFCPITTMFMDMEGSTRLNLLHSPSDVARIKNAFIRVAMEVVKAFDGHVHRVMGDAVMAYFGGKNARAESTAIDAINCAAVLQLLVRVSVVPFLEKQGFGSEFGIRIGVDYGPEERVLWRSYGFPEMEEVTATSFYVDVASKLQNAAIRHEVIVGNSLKELLDFPDDLLATKIVVRDGEEEQRPFLLPNLTDGSGNPINYRQHVLEWDKYLECSPVADRLPTGAAATKLQVTATIHATREGGSEGEFISCSTLGLKKKAVCFRIAKLPFVPQLPYVVKCIVENHGSEARQADKNLGNHETSYEVHNQADHKDILHWEDLAFCGLHYLTIEARKKCGTLIARKKFGVYVE